MPSACSTAKIRSRLLRRHQALRTACWPLTLPPPSMRCQHIEDGNLHAMITRENCSCVCELCMGKLPFPSACSIVIAESNAYQAAIGMPRQSLDIGMQAVQDNASIDLASGRRIPRSGELIAELWRLTSSCVSLTSAARLSTTVSTL